MKLIRVKKTKKADAAKKIEGFSIKSDGYIWKPSVSGNVWQTKVAGYTFVLIAYGGDYPHDGLKLAQYSVPTSVNDFLNENFGEIGVRFYSAPSYTIDFLSKILLS